MIRLLVLLVVAFCLLAACAPTTAVTPTPMTPTPLPPTDTPEPPTPFDYDASIPFDVIVNEEMERDGVTVVDLSFAGHDPAFSPSTNGRTLAYLVRPAGDGPFAGVIFFHWLGRPLGSREEYLDEAVRLAQEHGIVSLLPQGYFPWMHSFYGDERDRDLVSGQVKALRRAADFLIAQPEVDAERLAYVGHDYGAVFGGVLAGVEPRLKSYILIAGVPTFMDWGSYFGVEYDEYASIMEGLNPIDHLPQANPATILFQFAQKDAYVNEDQANKMFVAASEPKAIQWYDDLHGMTNEEARQARVTWLVEQLGLAQ